MMDSFKDVVRKSFAQKSMWRRMIGIIWVKTVQDFFWDKNIEWFIRFDTLYIKTNNQNVKIQAYQKKKELLEIINYKLWKFGYTRKIKDVRF